MKVKEHYDRHLGNVYSWIAGDFMLKKHEQQAYFLERDVIPNTSGNALDLGSGHGIQSVSLANIGFNVKAVDFTLQLLSELKANSLGLSVEAICGDIRDVLKYKDFQPEVIVCAGDTINHLSDKAEIDHFIFDCARTLTNKGKLMLSFRDYTQALTGDDRFILVKGDENTIFTCCLDYSDTHVCVTDVIYSKIELGWQQAVSSYFKVRIIPQAIIETIEKAGLRILYNEIVSRMVTVIAQKH